MTEMGRELVKRWTPHVQVAMQAGLSWDEVREIMNMVLEATPTDDGMCCLPIPANPMHNHVMRVLVAEVLEMCGLSPVIVLADAHDEGPARARRGL